MIFEFYNNVATSCPLLFHRYQIFRVHFHLHISVVEAWFFLKTLAAWLSATVLLTALSDQHWETETELQWAAGGDRQQWCSEDHSSAFPRSHLQLPWLFHQICYNPGTSKGSDKCGIYSAQKAAPLREGCSCTLPCLVEWAVAVSGSGNLPAGVIAPRK